ncbi:acid-sensing ion channel 1-like [Haliotis rufescens]|uniref:acid-sensing ion channel 1-like n=1 Tax=Haliotis rufescens TaxID=6454 RepID=UPI00201F14CA|nr:acid-sensing ion channel 1-like [Haliotis rufescens]
MKGVTEHYFTDNCVNNVFVETLEMNSENKHRLYVKPKLADHVSMQGVTQVTDVTSGTLRRSLWFLVICGGVMFTAFNIAKQIQLFVSSPVSVDVDVKLAQTLPFPAVTVCNTNIAKRSFIEMYGITEDLTNELRYDFQDVGLNITRHFGSEKIDHYYTEFSHTIYDSLLWCTWGDATCGFDNFTQTVTESGLCFTFNAQGTAFVRNSGRHYGLKMALDVKSEEFTRSRQNTEGEGFMITIHSPDTPPVITDTGMAVSPGSQYFFGLGMQEMDASEGLDNCGRRKLKYFEGKYSREACRKECFTDYLLKACSCREAYMPGNAKLCESEVVIDCINPSTEQYLLSRPDCESTCPDTCSYNTFTLKTASSLRVTDEYLSTLANETGD